MERHRDGLRLWGAMGDERASYALLGVESQADVNLAMPVRGMLYDAFAYTDQVNELKRVNRKQGGLDSKSFISGLKPDDRLLPVVTLVVHFGPDVWDAPTSVRGMLTNCDERLLRLVPDYRINLVSPASMGDDEFDKFKTDFGLVLGYIKYARNKKELEGFVTSHERYRSVDAESAELINLLTDSRLPVAHGEERVNMCEAIEEMRAEAMEKGMEKGTLTTLRDLVRDGVLSLADAAGRAGLSAEDFQAKVAAL